MTPKNCEPAMPIEKCMYNMSKRREGDRNKVREEAYIFIIIIIFSPKPSNYNFMNYELERVVGFF